MPHLLQADTPAATGIAGQTEEAPPAPGGFNPTTLLLLIVAAAFFWWSMRRRRVVEERMREQRRLETVTHAQESAQNVANIMRTAPRPDEAAAAASEGLASAARVPAARVVAPPEPVTEPVNGLGAATEAAEDEARKDARAQVFERAEAVAQADRVAEEEARRAAQEAAESEARRLAAAAAAAEEARADTADALRAREREATEALREGLRELDNEVEAPLGAIAGDGTPTCPPNFPIKGNAQSKIYHEPGQVSYPPTVAEFCFASAEAAEAAGFRQSRARGQRAQE
jgi:hypothetical protein